MLDIQDVGAYTIKDGVRENIIDWENNIIKTNIRDDVSDEFSKTFEELLELEFGE